MRAARIFFKGQEAGVLTQLDDGTFMFQYHPRWIDDPNKPAISHMRTESVCPSPVYRRSSPYRSRRTSSG
jgi:hypothetical protein